MKNRLEDEGPRRSGDSGEQAGPSRQAGVRVLCVDDHELLVEGLRAQFAVDGRLSIVGRLHSADALLEEVDRLKPDLVLLDIELPGPDSFEMADRLHHLHPRLRFAFLSAHVRDGYVGSAYRCGAWGYFSKGDRLEDIVEGLHEIASSRTAKFVLGPKVRDRCVSPGGSARAGVSSGETCPPTTLLDSLTPREAEVLRLIGKGLSRQEIADELSRSPKTIDGHQDHIMRKLGIDSRAKLMRFAIREGLAEA